MKFELIAVGALLFAAIVGGLGFFYLAPPPFIQGFGIYVLASAAFSFGCLLRVSKKNLIGAIMVALVTGWIYWPVFILAAMRRKPISPELDMHCIRDPHCVEWCGGDECTVSSTPERPPK